jgi:hypothetical protein
VVEPPQQDDESLTTRASSVGEEDARKHRRRVKRALLGLIAVIVLTGIFAYACSRSRVPKQLTNPPKAAGLTLQAPTADDSALARRLVSLGARPGVVARYQGPLNATTPQNSTAPQGDVVLVGARRDDISVSDLEGILPPATGGNTTYQGSGGTVVCAPTAEGSRCEWGDEDVLAGTFASGLDPAQLADLTRRMRSDVER